MSHFILYQAPMMFSDAQQTGSTSYLSVRAAKKDAQDLNYRVYYIYDLKSKLVARGYRMPDGKVEWVDYKASAWFIVYVAILCLVAASVLILGCYIVMNAH